MISICKNKFLFTKYGNVHFRSSMNYIILREQLQRQTGKKLCIFLIHISTII